MEETNVEAKAKDSSDEGECTFSPIADIGIFANTFIAGGTPLTMHYNYVERKFQENNTRCLCGDQIHCRGWLCDFPTCFSCGTTLRVKPLHCNRDAENASHVICVQCHCNTCTNCPFVEIL